MNDSIAIEFQEVVKRFGSVTAVDRVSFQIQAGEFFSLLGPSGCGKTTSLRLIAGFESPDEGQVLIEGQSQNGLPPHRRAVNTVFQNYALFPHMNVYQNVAFGLEMDRIPEAEKRRRVQAMLELVRLPGMHNRKPGQLSGGQQQRVALARALVKNPKVLLLDEPLGALDLKLRKAMQVELKLLQHQVGITFVYVTHDQEEALTMSDRIAVMNDGHVLQIGAPRDIYENPDSRFVADFIGETNLIPAQVEQDGDTWRVALENGQHFQAQLAVGLHAGDKALVSIRPEKIQLARPGETCDFGSETLSSESPVAVTRACLPGQVVQAVYLGTDTRYIVDLPGDIHIIARLQNMNGVETRFAPGDPVQVIWDAHHARVLKD